MNMRVDVFGDDCSVRMISMLIDSWEMAILEGILGNILRETCEDDIEILDIGNNQAIAGQLTML